MNRYVVVGATLPTIHGSVIGSLDSATATLAETADLPVGESANTSRSWRLPAGVSMLSGPA